MKRKTCSEGCIGGPPQYGGHHPGCPNAPDIDEDCGYEKDDPKHPAYRERMLDYADYERKRRLEDGDE